MGRFSGITRSPSAGPAFRSGPPPEDPQVLDGLLATGYTGTATPTPLMEASSVRAAAITFVYNESFNLPIWIRYFGSQFGHEEPVRGGPRFGRRQY